MPAVSDNNYDDEDDLIMEEHIVVAGSVGIPMAAAS